jgi:DNA-binding beta-propeller fold protein YncE
MFHWSQGDFPMRRNICLSILTLAVLTSSLSPALQAQSSGPYKVLSTTKVGGDGGFDYVYADSEGRRLYIPRPAQAGANVTVFDLDTFKPLAPIPGNARGVAVDEKSHHGFASSKPIAMWDSKSLAPLKTIDVDGGPDGILGDPFNHHIYVFSHRAPNATVINAEDGAIVGTIDLGGAPEQAVSDGAGHIYVDIEDKASIAVVDAATLKVTATYSLAGKGDGCAGLAIDQKNKILFATCREPNNMVILSATDGKILETLPIGKGTDGAVFNPQTNEAFSSNGEGNLTIVKEESPTKFTVEQILTTVPRAKTLTLDTKTGHILLIAAEFTPPPAPAPGEKPARPTMVPGSFSILVVGK